MERSPGSRNDYFDPDPHSENFILNFFYIFWVRDFVRTPMGSQTLSSIIGGGSLPGN